MHLLSVLLVLQALLLGTAFPKLMRATTGSHLTCDPPSKGRRGRIQLLLLKNVHWVGTTKSHVSFWYTQEGLAIHRTPPPPTHSPHTHSFLTVEASRTLTREDRGARLSYS